MSFEIGLSGINAASSSLSTASHNIANVGTTGFKYQRAEFADVFSNNVFSAARTSIGDGAIVSNVRQVFGQGNLDYTENALDLAINGPGFFMVSPTEDVLDPQFTRDGYFRLDAEGFIVDGEGQYLQTFPTDPDTGLVTSNSITAAQPVQLADQYGAAVQTSNVGIAANLPAGAAELPIAGFDPTDINTYSAATKAVIYDSLGESHSLFTYFIHTDSAANEWEVRTYVNDTALTPAPGESTTLQFDGGGALIAPANGDIQYDPEPLAAGSDPLTINVDLTPTPAELTTQFSSAFNVPYVSQDGATVGRLSGLSVETDGSVIAKYSNGRTVSLGKVILADFQNINGLRQIGYSSWNETLESGAAIVSEPGSGSVGTIQGGALETSNVDLTAQLVNLITAQRNFQANAKTIETSNTITQTIINI
ncbi:MAG: flagellar hook protein FlgE [Pseudomonadota bacterium]